MKNPNPNAQSLPTIGKARWSQIAPFVAVSRETWRQLGMKGKAPPAIRFSIRCTMWDCAEIHKWIHAPLDYTAPLNQADGQANGQAA